VNPGFGFQIAIGIVAFDGESNALYAGFLAGLIFENFFSIAAPVTPTEIHAQKNFRPVLRLSPPSSGMKRDNGIPPVVRTAEQLLELGFGHLFADSRYLCCCLGKGILAFFIFGDIKKKPGVFELGAMLRPCLDDCFERGLFLEDRLGFFCVVPEIRLGGDLVQLLDSFLLGFDVKDASAGDRDAVRGELAVLLFLPTLPFRFRRTDSFTLGIIA